MIGTNRLSFSDWTTSSGRNGFPNHRSMPTWETRKVGNGERAGSAPARREASFLCFQLKRQLEELQQDSTATAGPGEPCWMLRHCIARLVALGEDLVGELPGDCRDDDGRELERRRLLALPAQLSAGSHNNTQVDQHKQH